MQFEAELSKLSSRAERGTLVPLALSKNHDPSSCEINEGDGLSPSRSTLSLKAVASSPLRRHRFGNFHKRPCRMR